MNCIRCKSVRTFDFIDGFGQNRVFCKSCTISYLQSGIPEEQTKNEIQDLGTYFNYQAIRRG